MSIKITLTEDSESSVAELLEDLKQANLEEILKRHKAKVVAEIEFPKRNTNAAKAIARLPRPNGQDGRSPLKDIRELRQAGPGQILRSG